MTAKKMGYCQSCIKTGVELKLTLMNGKPYWLCEKCLNPLPRKAYELGRANSRKNWPGEEETKKAK